ncbi:acetyl esterase [Drechmeria coniospora]|uniref:Acetyl esterase n=1 Tax=Drechmeria coniospora TaxID=98403 RepID=A0A151GCI5_DRECN|nr:acetyl esterase [Drechmeria coniospora]KYK54773.1 acetyl esterase [Drechmeria coniospora]ODA76002.1 hypothetical protein RJ55_08284 [Drechmeria coniospora]
MIPLTTLVHLAVVVMAMAASPDRVAGMENLVAFGDSYTDEGRLDYFTSHGKAPPVGSLLPPKSITFSGGYAWGRIVANRTGARFYNYAVGGAMCSNDVVGRQLDAPLVPLPSVIEYEMATYEADLAHGALYPNRRPFNTVYALWIGTNDLGVGGFLGNAQRSNRTIRSFVECVWSALDRIYETGGRRFVLMNELPLETAPMYANPGLYGKGNDRYWRDPSTYDTADGQRAVREYTTSVNTMFEYGLPFHHLVKKRWPAASVSLLDLHSLWSGVRADPMRHLDAPANLTAPYRICLSGCVKSAERLSSFMWYDELHPSERMEEIIGKSFIDVVRGASKYGTTYDRY